MGDLSVCWQTGLMFVWKIVVFLVLLAQLDMLNFMIFATLIIHKGSPWARKKMIKLDVYGIWKPGLVSSVSLQMVPLENLREVFKCAGSCTRECIWELPGHIKSKRVYHEISQTILKCHEVWGFFQLFLAVPAGYYCTGKMRTCE